MHRTAEPGTQTRSHLSSGLLARLCCALLTCALAQSLLGQSAPTLPVSSLDSVATFNGQTGLLKTCVGLYDGKGTLLKRANGSAETYTVEMAYTPSLGATGKAGFQIRRVDFATGSTCTGVYQNEAFTDSVLIANVSPDMNGKVFKLTLARQPGTSFDFTLSTSAAFFTEQRNLAANTTGLGQNLGSFASTATRRYNTVSLPARLAVTAPQCSDAEGDTTAALIELNGVTVASATPGASVTIDTSGLATGTHNVRAQCTDQQALTATAIKRSYGAISAYASGTVQVQVENNPQCQKSIDAVMRDLDRNYPDNVPTWEQLACYTHGQTRQDRPTTFLLAGGAPPVADFSITTHPTFMETVQRDLDLIAAWPEANLYGTNGVEIPPFLTDANDTFTAAEWDLKLRGIAVFGLYLKHHGHRIKVDYFTPPTSNQPVLKSADEFMNWWRTVYIPERVSLARMAETIKAEYLQPWDVEPGHFLRTAGKTWLSALSEDAQVALAQQMIDTLYAALRPEFTGTLMMINYDRYAVTGYHWKRLNLAEWDEVYFGIFTEGDVEGTQMYLDQQLPTYLEMVQRDGLKRWMLGEVTVNPATHQRLLDSMGQGVKFNDIEVDVYRTLFKRLESLPASFSGIGVTVGHIQTPAAKALVHAEFAKLLQRR